MYMGRHLWLLITDTQIHILNSILDNVIFGVEQISHLIIFKLYIFILICGFNKVTV